MNLPVPTEASAEPVTLDCGCRLWYDVEGTRKILRMVQCRRMCMAVPEALEAYGRGG